MVDRRFFENPRQDGLVGSEVIPVTSMVGGTEVGTGDPIAPEDDAYVTVDDIYDHFVDTDGTLAADSDDVVPSQKAVKDYVDTSIAAIGPSSFSIGLTFLADTSSTSDADPGAGNFRWNNATQASATVVYIDDVTHGGGATLTGIWAVLAGGGFLYTQHPANAAIWSINLATAIVDASGYAKLTITRLAGEGSFADNDPMIVTIGQGAVGGGGVTSVNGASGTPLILVPFAIAFSDETTPITAGTGKATWINPSDKVFNVVHVTASLNAAQTSGSIFTIDINEAGTSILSTKLTIDNLETVGGSHASAGSATPAVISDGSIAGFAKVSVDVDQIGSGTGAGGKVYLLGYWTP